MVSLVFLPFYFISQMSEKDTVLVKDFHDVKLFLADSHLNAAKCAAVPDQKQLNLFSNIYLWIMKTYVYLQIYYGDKLLSETVCNNLLKSLQGVTQDEFVFLKCLSKIVGKEQNTSSMIENMRMMSTIARKHMSANLWKVCHFYCLHISVIILKKGVDMLAYCVSIIVIIIINLFIVDVKGYLH